MSQELGTPGPPETLKRSDPKYGMRFLSSLLLLAFGPFLTVGSLFAQTASPPEAPGKIENLDAFIQDPTVFAQNQEPTHAPRTVPYPSVKAARQANEFGTELEDRWSQSPYFQLLNGTWAFAFFERPAAVPASHEDVNWKTIRVPKPWQAAGYDQFVYENTRPTWDGINEAPNTIPPEVPGEWTWTTVPFDRPDLTAGTNYWLTVSLHLASGTPYADAGYPVATERLQVPFDVPPAPTVDGSALPSLSATESERTVTVSGYDFEYELSKDTGTFSSLTYRGTDVLVKEPQLNFWRAPILGEDQCCWGNPSEEWRAAGLHDPTFDPQSITVREAPGAVRIDVESRYRGAGKPRASVSYAYTVLGSGEVLMTVDVQPTDSLRAAVTSLPRVGIEFGVPTAFNRLQWYGRGPGGSFPDRPGGMQPGVYEGTVADQFEPVVPPQVNGLKTDTRWTALTNAEMGLLIYGDSTMTFGVNPFSNLSTADHKGALRKGDSLSVSLDHALMGAGTKFHSPVESTLVPPKPARFRVVFRPYAPTEKSPSVLSTRQFELPEELR